MKLWTVDNPPEWLAGRTSGEVLFALAAFRAAMDKGLAEDEAQRLALEAVTAAADGQARERAGALRFQVARASEDGNSWEAVLIAPGLSKGWPQFWWPADALEAAVGLFENVDVNAYEVRTDYFSHLQVPAPVSLEDVKRYLTSRKVGWISAPRWEPGVGIVARVNFLPDAAWVVDALAEGQAKGNPDVLGLSIDSRISGIEVGFPDGDVIWVTSIKSVSSVDVVTRPAAGGKFLRAVAGLNKTEDTMDLAKFLKLIEQVRPDLLQGKDQAALTGDQVLELARMAMEPAQPDGKTKPEPAARDDKGQRAAMSAEEIGALLEGLVAKSMQVVEQRAAMDQALAGSGLPEAGKARVREVLAGKDLTVEAVDRAIKAEKDYLASMAQPGSGFAVLGDQGRLTVGMGSQARIQLAVDRLFGLSRDDVLAAARMDRLDGRPFFPDLRVAQAEEYNDVPRLTGLAELYTLLTGDAEIRGHFNRQGLMQDLRAAQDITSATFSYVLGNTLGRRLVKDYAEPEFQEGLLISVRKPVKDYRQQEAVLVGGFGDIEDVDPEAADYQEISAVGDEESVYAIGIKGNILTITEKTIRNDDISLVQRLVRRLGVAARRTHAKYVWGKWINNAACSDGTAWFTAGHGNLGTAALSFAAAIAAYQALAKMTEKDSGERLGLLANPAVKPVLVYPVDLMAMAESIVGDDDYYTSNDLTTKTRNPLKGKITGAQIPLFTDATDWGLLMPTSVCDCVEMGYMDGRQEPEMFVADQPSSEQVFVADKIRYKIRHRYAGAVVDFRSGYKGAVAG